MSWSLLVLLLAAGVLGAGVLVGVLVAGIVLMAMRKKDGDKE